MGIIVIKCITRIVLLLKMAKFIVIIICFHYDNLYKMKFPKL
jgi:hypothetical protein